MALTASSVPKSDCGLIASFVSRKSVGSKRQSNANPMSEIGYIYEGAAARFGPGIIVSLLLAKLSNDMKG